MAAAMPNDVAALGREPQTMECGVKRRFGWECRCMSVVARGHESGGLPTAATRWSWNLIDLPLHSGASA